MTSTTTVRSRLILSAVVAVTAAATIPTDRALAQAGASAMPLDMAFGRRVVARENPIAISPDGALVAYVVFAPPEKSPGDSRYLPSGVPVTAIGNQIFISPAAGGAAYAAGPEGANCWRPSFSPDGKRLAFYCDKSGSTQLFIHDVATRQTRLGADARVKAKLWIGDEPLWSPDGRHIYVPLAPAAPAPAPVTAAARTGPAVTVYRSEGAPEPTRASSDDKASMDFLMRENNAAIAGIDATSGTVKILAPADAVPPPSVLRVSPTGKWIAYLSVFHKPRALDTTSFHDLAVVSAAGGAVRVVAPDLRLPSTSYHTGNYAWHPTRDQLFWIKDDGLWTLEVDGAASPRRLTPETIKVTLAPIAVTKDGSAVLVGTDGLDMRDYRDPYPRALALVPISGGGARPVPLPDGLTFQSAVMANYSVLWQPSPASFSVLARENATTENVVLRIDPSAGTATTLWKGLGRLGLGGVTGDHSVIVGSFENLDTPMDVFRFDPSFANRTRVTTLEPRLADVRFGPVETFETRVPQYDGSQQTVTTAVLLPPGKKKGDKLPTLVFLYPGGKVSRAAGEFGGGMPSTVPVSAFTTRGYAVLLAELPISPDGTAGNPVQEMVDVLLPQVYRAAELGYSDVNRLAVSGQSYGGYGTASIVSGTNVFRAGIAISGLYDLGAIHSWMSRDGMAAMARWSETGQGRMGTHPWGDLRRYLTNSPYYRADYIRTPLLMLHGAVDYTCPVEDARKMFNALKRMNRTAELAVYDGEGHVVYGWSRINAVDATERMLKFLETHLGAPRPAKTSSQ
jgi:dipeptidyl aminopeptidase/acylaminoacyl peptidase